jgi:hypothetical protein
MNYRKSFALAAASIAVVIAPPTAALAAGISKVTVRIEGKTRNLLGSKVVQTQSGSITKSGAPAGACSATSGAGALNVATHGRWGGSFSTGFHDYLISSILGDTEPGSPFYWGIWIDNRFSQTGACGIKLHSGESLLFAVDSATHHEHPLGLSGPAKVKAGHPFTVKVVAFSDKGVAKPLAGAHVHGFGVNGRTNKKGLMQITGTGAGVLTFQADEKGFIRAASLRVKVS